MMASGPAQKTPNTVQPAPDESLTYRDGQQNSLPSFLVKDEIRGFCSSSEESLIADPLDSNFKNWSYDLRLGEEAYLSSAEQLSYLRDKQAIFIKPGEFALLLTKEKLRMRPNLVGFISLKSSHAFKGLVNISGFQVDPGYVGKLALSVYNAGPNTVVLREGDPLYMIIFARLARDAKPRKDEGPRYPQITHLTAEMISAVKGPPVSLINLHDRVSRLEQLLYVLGGVLVAAIGTVVAAFVLGIFHV